MFLTREKEAVKHDLIKFKVQCLEVYFCHGYKPIMLLFNSIFGTIPEISSTLYFGEMSEVLDK